MSNPLDNEDSVAGALAATNGDTVVDPVAAGNWESTVDNGYRVDDMRSDEGRVVLAGDNDDGGTPFCDPCDPDDQTEFTKAFIKTLRFGGPEDAPSSWPVSGRPTPGFPMGPTWV
jgi:hypothetical protein